MAVHPQVESGIVEEQLVEVQVATALQFQVRTWAAVQAMKAL